MRFGLAICRSYRPRSGLLCSPTAFGPTNSPASCEHYKPARVRADRAADPNRLVPWADSCVLYQHVDLTDDLAAAHLERRFDQHAAAVRVLASFPKLHPSVAHDNPLDAVRGRSEERFSRS